MFRFELIVFLGVLLCIGVCQSQLQCYTCYPENDKAREDCKYPVENYARYAPCETNNNSTSLCLSTYIQNQNESLSGIYRKCINKPLSVGDVCDWVKETTNNTVKSCFACNETRCNTILLYPDGTSAADSAYKFYCVMLINAVLIMILRYTYN